MKDHKDHLLLTIEFEVEKIWKEVLEFFEAKKKLGVLPDSAEINTKIKDYLKKGVAWKIIPGVGCFDFKANKFNDGFQSFNLVDDEDLYHTEFGLTVGFFDQLDPKCFSVSVYDRMYEIREQKDQGEHGRAFCKAPLLHLLDISNRSKKFMESREKYLLRIKNEHTSLLHHFGWSRAFFDEDTHSEGGDAILWIRNDYCEFTLEHREDLACNKLFNFTEGFKSYLTNF